MSDKVNGFDILKRMSTENLDIRSCSADNITEMKKVSAGTKVTFGVPGDVIGGIYLGDLSACLIIFNSKQFADTKLTMESEREASV